MKMLKNMFSPASIFRVFFVILDGFLEAFGQSVGSGTAPGQVFAPFSIRFGIIF